MERIFDAIIIGAGLAGLSAGLELKRFNKSFLLLEASQQVGGRARTIQTKSGDFIDLGAQWIGPKKLQPRIHDLIDRFGLTKVKTYKTGKNVYEFEGKIRQRPEWLPPIPLKSLLELRFISSKINKITELLQQDGVFQSTISHELDQMSYHDWIEKNIKTQSAKNFHSMLAQEGNSVELSKLSALDVFWSLQATGGLANTENAEEFWLKEGAQTLAIRMSETFKENLHLNSPVEKVEQSNDTVSVYVHGQKWKARRLIVTVPLNVLHRIAFEPALPKGLLSMMDSVSPSAVIKFQLLFDEPFWRKKGLSGTSYSDIGEFQLSADSSTKETGILTLLVTGIKARELSKLNPTEQNKLVLLHAEKLFGTEIRQVKEIHHQDWLKEDWIQSGYGYHFYPHSLSYHGHSLLQPYGQIHWAGAETATQWRMYREGAIQSGIRAANEVVENLDGY